VVQGEQMMGVALFGPRVRCDAMYQHHARLQWEVIEDQVVMLDTDAQELLRLNVVASQLWQWLGTPCSADMLVTRLTETFDVTAAQARRDVRRWLQRALRAEWIFDVSAVSHA
jgi:hypothetical protein